MASRAPLPLPLLPLLVLLLLATAGAQDRRSWSAPLAAEGFRPVLAAQRTYRPRAIPLAGSKALHRDVARVFYGNNSTGAPNSDDGDGVRPTARTNTINRRLDPVAASVRDSYTSDTTEVSRRLFDEGRGKLKKKYKKYLLPLLLAYKLKFFTLIPLMMGGLVLLAGATGLAGFFFALFSATMGLKAGSYHK